MKTYTFDQLSDSQKQIIAARWASDVAHFSLENTLVEYVLNKSCEDSEAPFCYEDITNNEYYGVITINGYEHQLTESERDEKLEFYEYLRDKVETIRDNLDGSKIDSHYDRFDNWADELQAICDDLESMDFDQQAEIYQWFRCDSYACRKLEEAGQCTLDGNFWGRQCCGQSIELDHCIQKIAFDYYSEYNTSHITQERIELERFDVDSFWSM